MSARRPLLPPGYSWYPAETGYGTAQWLLHAGKPVGLVALTGNSVWTCHLLEPSGDSFAFVLCTTRELAMAQLSAWANQRADEHA